MPMTMLVVVRTREPGGGLDVTAAALNSALQRRYRVHAKAVAAWWP